MAGGTIGANREKRKICFSFRGVENLRREAAVGGSAVAEAVKVKSVRKLKGRFRRVVKQ